MGQWQYIQVVGQPVASSMAFIALILIAFATEVAAQIVRVAHEGGHMLAALLFGRRITRFDLQEARGAGPLGSATHTDPKTGFGDVFISFAGYATPPLVGLIGAHVIANGNSWGVLVAGVVLLLAVLVIPEINPQDALKLLAAGKGIISSPNCSTTQMVIALKPLHDVSRLNHDAPRRNSVR